MSPTYLLSRYAPGALLWWQATLCLSTTSRFKRFCKGTACALVARDVNGVGHCGGGAWICARGRATASCHSTVSLPPSLPFANRPARVPFTIKRRRDGVWAASKNASPHRRLRSPAGRRHFWRAGLDPCSLSVYRVALNGGGSGRHQTQKPGGSSPRRWRPSTPPARYTTARYHIACDTRPDIFAVERRERRGAVGAANCACLYDVVR